MPAPQNYYLTHQQLGTWEGRAWQERIQDALPEESMRLAYD